jgi:hypothetical protein
MKVKVKFTNDDPMGWRKNKFVKYGALVMGVLLLSLEIAGFFLRMYKPEFAAPLGEQSILRILSGVCFLGLYLLLRK